MRRFLLLAAVAAPLVAAIPLPPSPSRYVTDAANVIPDDREHALNEKLAAFERSTTNQVIVYVDRKVPEGTTLEEMGAEAIKTWAVGQAKKDNGAILFLFIDDRKSRVEVGYGLEGVLTDARSKRILVSMRPALRAGDYAAAAEAGANAILEIIRDPNAVQAVATPPERGGDSGLVVLLIIVAFIFGVVVILIAVWVLANRSTSGGTSSAWTSDSSSNDWSSSSSSSDFSSSSSSDSSSDSTSSFDGGGGSGGGGGASDSW